MLEGTELWVCKMRNPRDGCTIQAMHLIARSRGSKMQVVMTFTVCLVYHTKNNRKANVSSFPLSVR